MKKIPAILLVLFLCTGLSSCIHISLEGNKNKKDNNYKNVTTEDAYKLITSTKNLIILDVRTDKEFKSGHIKGAILIPENDLDNKINQIMKYRDNPILVYCRTGRRSKDAVEILSKKGFKDIYHMYQGISLWKYDLEE